jgi:uncharacterized membrane protein YccC
MNETERPWNEKVMDSLKQTGDSIRAKAHELVHELQDPANHERVKQSLAEMGDWAKKTAEDAAVMVDQAAQKVEQALTQAARKATKKAKPAAKKKPAKKAKKAPRRKK